MSTLYDKNYELPKNCYGLSKPAYIVVTARLREYKDFKERIYEIDKKSGQNITKEDILNKTVMESIVNAIEKGLLWVSKDVREAIWTYASNHYSNGITWEEVAQKYNYSSSYLRLQYAKYIYGVAYELGEII